VVGVLTARGAADESDKPSPFGGRWGAFWFNSRFGGKGARGADTELAGRKWSPASGDQYQIALIAKASVVSRPQGGALRFQCARLIDASQAELDASTHSESRHVYRAGPMGRWRRENRRGAGRGRL
jgi:hypothetical protein